MWWRALNIEIGATLGCIEEALIAGKPIRGSKTIERPCLAPRPRRIVSPALVGRLAQELAVLQFEYAFVGSAAVAAHEVPSRRQAVFARFPEQVPVAGPIGCVKDDAHVHHDVDETAVGSHEGS